MKSLSIGGRTLAGAGADEVLGGAALGTGLGCETAAVAARAFAQLARLVASVGRSLTPRSGAGARRGGSAREPSVRGLVCAATLDAAAVGVGAVRGAGGGAGGSGFWGLLTVRC